MVKGLQRFQDHFRDFQETYVVIGGTACDLLFTEQSMPFRATKDVDMVLVVDALDDAFVRHFWEFVHAGGYQRQQRSEKRQYYRFVKPASAGYPAMLELFSGRLKQSDIGAGKKIAVIPAGEDISSLSAILLDGAYYNLIRETKMVLHDLPIVRADGLIPLKAKAWLDLAERRRLGERVNDRDLKKHRNDVFGLSFILVDPPFALDGSIRADLQDFLNAFPHGSLEWPDIHASLRETYGVKTNSEEIVSALARHFNLAMPKKLAGPQ
jgi:hypothetical protein